MNRTLLRIENAVQIHAPVIVTIVQVMDNFCGAHDVYITSGAYEIDGRLSNHWYWRDIDDEGHLGTEHHGYGLFYESISLYEIDVHCKRVGPRVAPVKMHSARLEIEILEEEALLLKILNKPRPHWSKVQTAMALRLQEYGLVRLQSFVKGAKTQAVRITLLGKKYIEE